MVTEHTHYWERFGFFGGHTFLDFINTVDDVEKSREREGIGHWDVLLRWALAANIVNETEATELTTNFPTGQVQAELDKLHRFRELSWRTLRVIASGTAPDAEDLRALSDEIRWAYTQATLTHKDQGLAWDTHSQRPELALIRTRLGLAADKLLSHHPLKIIECGSCTGLFLNQGRGVGRKWCRMQSCGNRAKVNKFRAR